MIDVNDLELLKQTFVTRDECNLNTKEMNVKFASDSTRLAVIEQQLKMITWLLTAVGGGIITMLIKLFFGG